MAESRLILTAEQVEQLRQLDTCTVSNAIERFELRLRNTGFTDASVRCMFPHLPPTVGYAVTASVRTSVPPMDGRLYYDRTDWLDYVLSTPAPRIVVLRDVDKKPGVGAFVGEIHAHILLALGCVGVITNGAVRDLPSIEPTGFQLFAGNVAVSHAYAHLFEFGRPVEVGGLEIHPGDLLHGDRHGVVTVPRRIAAELPAVARQLLETERRLVEFCRSPNFSLEKLRELIKGGGSVRLPRTPPDRD
jgi:4-hydroxy-4-methyl-2-oxoglutarate aldolase